MRNIFGAIVLALCRRVDMGLWRRAGDGIASGGGASWTSAE